MDILSMQNVSLSFGSTRALDGLSFAVKEGEIFGFLGPSGAGKTTVLNMLGGMDTCDEGHIWLDGKEVSAYNQRQLTEYRRYDVGFVFQFYNLVQNLTALENVELASEICRDPLDPKETLRGVGLGERLNNFPAQLSGGQKQRVAIAGIIAMQTGCIVLDEPTAMLDPRGRREVFDTVRRLNREMGITVLFVTHFMDEAVKADRVIIIDSGRLCLDGTPREVFSQTDVLRRCGLDVPQSTELCHRLIEKGIDLPGDILDADECVEALSKIMEVSR